MKVRIGLLIILFIFHSLSDLYSSKFDLIFDHKLKIDGTKINEIVKMLERKSEEKLKNLDYRGAIKALRRAEKYISN